MKKSILAAAVILTFFACAANAAVGCDLNDPDRDVKRFFPQSTSYKTDYFSILKLGGKPLLKEIEEKLGDAFSGTYETIDVPYALYTVYKGSQIAGYIHGINQKGKYGGLQVFLIYSPDLRIENFYYQKLASKQAKEMRSAEFAKQFKGLTFKDFESYDAKTSYDKQLNKPASRAYKNIKNPSPTDDIDFLATLRAVKKNLILTDIFIDGR